MSPPQSCPVCNDTSIEPVLRSTLLSAEIGHELHHAAGVLAYRCGAGHVFMIVPKAEAAKAD